MPNVSITLNTEHGLISVSDTTLKNSAPALLLIHGNSSSSKIWRPIQDNPAITQRWRVVAFDLPGHGASSNAPDPDKSYSMHGYADLAVHILSHLNISQVVVLGWSLGGHVGIEMVRLVRERRISMKGLMIVGTPPARGVEQIKAGFVLEDAHMALPAKKDWSEEDVRGFARNSAGEPFEAWMEDCARRTDGRARMFMFQKFAGGEGVDQREVVESEDVLVAVVNGGSEPYVNLEYFDGIQWKSLWREECVRLEGLGHAPFWEKPEEFGKLLVEFVGDCERVE